MNVGRGGRWACLIGVSVPLAAAGCGGSDPPPAASAPAAAAPVAAMPGAHGDPHAAGGHGEGHGQPAPGGHDAHGGGHDQAAAHGQPASPHDAHGQPAGGHDQPPAQAVDPHAAHGEQNQIAMAHGQPAPHGQPAAHAQPASPHAQPVSPHDAHGQPAMTPGGPAAPGVKPQDGWYTWLIFGGASGGPPAGGPAMAGGAHGEAGPAMDAHGQPAAPGVPGADVPVAPGQAPGQVQQFDADSAEYAVQQVILKLQAGTADGLDQFISPKAKDELGKLRANAVDPAMLTAAQQAVSGVQLVNTRDSGTSKVITLRNAAGQTLTFTCRKEDGAYKVADLKIAARGRR